MTTCSVEGCGKATSARGLCPGHYNRLLLGKPVNVQLGPSLKSVPIEVRFWSRVSKTATCWLWTGPLYDGYGRIKLASIHWKAHRLSYTWAVGPIPNDKQVDHKCRNRACVRPDHLQLVTAGENMQNLGIRADNTSGVRGVSWRAKDRAWAVRVARPGGERIWGGLFKDLAEAEAVAIALRNEVMTNNLQDRRTA